MSVLPEEIVIREEIKSLIPPLSKDERDRLEDSLLEDGCLDALKVWRSPSAIYKDLSDGGKGHCKYCNKDTCWEWCDEVFDGWCLDCKTCGHTSRFDGDLVLIDGHNRYEICTRRSIEFRIEEVLVHEDFDGVINWIVDYQLGRRNLTDFAKVELLDSKRRLLERKAGKRKTAMLRRGDESPVTEKLPERETSRADRETRNIIAKDAGISGRTVDKAVKILKDADEDTKAKVRSGQKSIHSAYNELRNKEKRETSKRAAEDARSKGLPSSATGILHGDFRDIASDIPDDSVDLIFTDPPYDRAFLPTYAHLGLVAERVLKPGGSLVTYLGSLHLPAVCRYLEDAGLRFLWPMCVLHTGADLQMREYGIRNGWKPLLWFVKGSNRCDPTRIVRDVIVSKQEKSHHDWQQAEADAAHCIEALTDPGELVFDPFCGGGTTAAVCKKLGRKWLTCDIDESCVAAAAGRIA